MIPREILKKIRQIELRTNRIVTETLAGIPLLSLLLFCSCATSSRQSTIVAAPELPAAVAINYNPDALDHLFVTLRFDDGAELPFALDTGSTMTHLPTSFESKLGRRIGTRTFEGFDGKQKQDIYSAPRLHLNDTVLKTGRHIATQNDPIGILGMDCLRHYCIQIDFQTGKLRFLDPETVDPTGLGKPYPLLRSSIARIYHQGLLGGRETALLIDTGYSLDAMAESRRFHQAIQEGRGEFASVWEDGMFVQTNAGPACFTAENWSGNTYTNNLIEAGKPTLVGLRFLSRHLVTFNFPKRMMYLKPRSLGPLGRPIKFLIPHDPPRDS